MFGHQVLLFNSYFKVLAACWGNECSLMFVSNCNENIVRGQRKSLKMSSDFFTRFFVTVISCNLDTPLRKPPTSCFGANTSNHKSVRTLDATASIDNNNNINNNYDVNTTDWGAFWLLSSTDFSVLLLSWLCRSSFAIQFKLSAAVCRTHNPLKGISVEKLPEKRYISGQRGPLIFHIFIHVSIY